MPFGGVHLRCAHRAHVDQNCALRWALHCGIAIAVFWKCCQWLADGSACLCCAAVMMTIADLLRSLVLVQACGNTVVE
jgi:hypothetical protein